MTPHVPQPVGNLVMAVIFGVTVGFAVVCLLLVLARGLRRDLKRAAIAGAVVAAVTIGIVIQTRAVDRAFGGYFSFKSPRDRLQDHFADFDERLARDPEISKALEGFPVPAMKLADLRRRGVARLDDATLRRRAELQSTLLSQVGDHACGCIMWQAPPTPADEADIQQAMLRLESKFIAAWMEVLYQATLAEVRKSPAHPVTEEELLSALRVIAARVGRADARRLRAGLSPGASDADRCWAAKRILAVAPTLPEPHGTILLRSFP